MYDRYSQFKSTSAGIKPHQCCSSSLLLFPLCGSSSLRAQAESHARQCRRRSLFKSHLSRFVGLFGLNCRRGCGVSGPAGPGRAECGPAGPGRAGPGRILLATSPHLHRHANRRRRRRPSDAAEEERNPRAGAAPQSRIKFTHGLMIVCSRQKRFVQSSM